MAFTVDKDLFSSFAFYSAVLGGKVLLMAPLTAYQRFGNKVFMNPEDTPLSDGSKVDFANPAVERVRRAHQNDLENIVPFFVLAPLYLTTGPQAPLANNLFRVFTAARILHTIVYLNKVPQPSRFAACLVGFAINGFMVYSIIKHYTK